MKLINFHINILRLSEYLQWKCIRCHWSYWCVPGWHLQLRINVCMNLCMEELWPFINSNIFCVTAYSIVYAMHCYFFPSSSPLFIPFHVWLFVVRFLFRRFSMMILMAMGVVAATVTTTTMKYSAHVWLANTQPSIPIKHCLRFTLY